MLPEKRRQEILRFNKEQQGVSIKELSNYFKISNMTVLRDIKLLEKKGLLEVVRGGVIPLKSSLNEVEQSVEIYDSKRKQSLSEKQQIASYCANTFVKEGNVIILEAGSTAGAMVNFLRNKKKITVISNGLFVIKEAVEKLDPTSRIICTGGLLEKPYSTFVGPDVDNFFINKQTDIAFVSCVAFDLTLGAMDSSPLDIQAKRAILKSAQRRILMVDKYKFNVRSVMQTIEISKITDIVTNSSIDENISKVLKNFKNIEVHLV